MALSLEWPNGVFSRHGRNLLRSRRGKGKLNHWQVDSALRGRFMTLTGHGKIHGNTIELDSALGLPDGAEVEVTVVISKPKQLWGAGLQRSAGVAADFAEFDAVFEQIAQDRQAASFRESAS
jgi:hypothetical protein